MSLHWIARNTTLVLAFTLVMGLALACGDSTEMAGGDEAASASKPDVAAPAAAPDRPAQSAAKATPEAMAKTAEDPGARSCLDLVKAGKFADAIKPCTEAARRAPGNQEVAAALEKAKSGSMQQATAAGGAAKDAAANAVGGLGDQLP